MEFKERPLGEMVVVELEDLEDPNRESRVRLPDWQKTLRGKVLATGPGEPIMYGVVAPMQCRVGDLVIFGAATGMESTYNGKRIRIMRDRDVDAVVESGVADAINS